MTASGVTSPIVRRGPPRLPDDSLTLLRDMAVSPDGTRLAISFAFNAYVMALDGPASSSPALTWRRGEVVQEVQFSSDGQHLGVSGDGWNITRVNDRGVADEPNATFWSAWDPTTNASLYCQGTLARISGRSTWLAVSAGTSELLVRRAFDVDGTYKRLPTAHCNARAAFSSDERLMATTGPELYRTGDWQRLWPLDVSPGVPANPSGYDDVQFIPGEQHLLVSSCPQDATRHVDSCTYAVYSVATGALARRLPTFHAFQATVSPEGHWVAAAGMLVHLPTGTERTLAGKNDPPTVSAFAPNGDLLVGTTHNNLIRYCRR